MPGHSTVHSLQVTEIRPLTCDSVVIDFEVPQALRPLFAFRAGQHLPIVCADGARRSFSLCSTPASGTWRIGVKRLPEGAFSDRAVAELRPGDTLEVMTPAGRFVCDPDPSRRACYVVIAAGSGITPLLSIVTTLLEEEPESEVTLVYANRTSASVMFLDELHDLKDRFLTRFQLLHVLSREEREVRLLSGRLDSARLDAVLAAFVPSQVQEWFLCGPQAMVHELREHLLGLGAEKVHTELFHAEDQPPRPSTPQQVEGAAQVTVRLDGRATELTLRPDGVSILEAATALRRDIPFACKGGVCGTCRARVLEGSVEMERNYALEPDEVRRGYVLTCQSHPTTPRVVLDYDG